MKKILAVVIAFLFIVPLFSSTREDALKRLYPRWKTPDPAIRINAFEKRKELLAKSPFSGLKFINVEL